MRRCFLDGSENPILSAGDLHAAFQSKWMINALSSASLWYFTFSGRSIFFRGSILSLPVCGWVFFVSLDPAVLS